MDSYHENTLAEFWLGFTDSFKIIIVLKMIFFLPTYFIGYILMQKIIDKDIIWKHLQLHSISVLILAAFFTPFVATKQGLILITISSLLAWLSIFIVKLAFKESPSRVSG